jgi:hypothetical protein
VRGERIEEEKGDEGERRIRGRVGAGKIVKRGGKGR